MGVLYFVAGVFVTTGILGQIHDPQSAWFFAIIPALPALIGAVLLEHKLLG